MSSVKEINIPKVRKQAEEYYKNGDFYCSEALLKSVKDAFDAPYGDEIVKLASGFPVGMNNGCTCGAVSGGIMALGMFFGRDKAKDKKVEKCMQPAKELQDRFTAKRKVNCCKILTKGMTLGSDEHMKHCITMTGEVTQITCEIIARELNCKTL